MFQEFLLQGQKKKNKKNKQIINKLKFMKTKNILYLIIGIFMSFQGFAQKQIDKSGHIHIFSETSLFTIEADNYKVASILDISTGDIVVTTLVRSFKFHEALVEEHFNENYMESTKFPKASFKGKIVNNASVSYTKDGTYNVDIEGDLTIHGETRHVKEKAVITVKNGKISANTTIHISLANYKIKVEESYKDRINDDIKLVITFNYAAVVAK